MLLLVQTLGHAAPLTPEEAESHVGETATVCGMVASTNYVPTGPMAPTFLDLGRSYPDNVLTVIIFDVDRPKFGSPEISLQGHTIGVTGEIFRYEGKTRMALRDPKQLTAE